MTNLLLTRLTNLQKEDFQRFVTFVNSPYFHKGEKAIQYIDLIRPYYPDFDLPNSILKKADKLFPSKTAHGVLLSRMNDLLDEFELYEQFNRKSFLKNSLRHELELEKKNNIKLYEQLQNEEAVHVKSSDDFYADFYKEFASIAICENNWIRDKEKIIDHSEKAMQNILYFFLSKYLMIYANEITHSINLPAREETTGTKIVLDFVGMHLTDLPLSVQSVYYVIQLFKNISGSNTEFDRYYAALRQQTFGLSKQDISYEIKYALAQASSACVFKCYSKPEYFKKAFEMSKFLVENELYFSDLHETVIQQRFILIVKIALGAGETAWAKNFIEEKNMLIKKAVRDDFYNYALGLIYFHQHQYNDAVKRMLKINLNSAQFIVDYKLTLLKMYYELHELAGFNYQSKTFLKFLGKDKSLNKTHKKNVLDSVELIKWLFKFQKNKKPTELKEKVETRKLTYLLEDYRDKWFAEKYEELLPSA